MLGGALSASGCHKPAPPPVKPPLETFVPGEWRTPKGVVMNAPPASNRAWRVLALQESPRPKKNPHWKTIAIQDSGILEMPVGSHFQCLYNPVKFRSWPNEHVSSVAKWELMRSVRCSNDGWATYSQAIHVVTISGDGATVIPAIDQTELSLNETIDGKPVQSSIVLRADDGTTPTK